MRIEISRGRAILLAMIALVCALLVLVGALASYTGVLTPSTRVFLYADRAGLLMEPGSDVKVKGMVIGRVDRVELDDDHATLILELKPEEARKLPSNVGADIAPTTLFGRKFVTLVTPEYPLTSTLTAGSVIDNAKVSVEINRTFQSLLGVLDTIEPQKVSATLTALDTALDGRGERFGDLLVDVDRYLGQFNESMPILQRDIPLLADNIETFAAVTPDFMDTVGNLSVAGNTVVEKQAQLSAFLLSFTTFGNTGTQVLDRSGTPLIRAVDALDPTTRLLAEYSPSYPCFFSSLNQSRRYLERAFGGDRPGLNILGTLLMGDPPYTYEEDLPVNGADNPPSCYGYPYGPNSAPPGHTDFNTGTTVYGPVLSPMDLIGNPFASLIYGMTR
ncbi:MULTISPECIES: MCE family protein [Rhodococcus]|uniref:MCE family protein n=1 Tax=Rhodococcus TaxID=1827 RepID=UPI000718190A|nr:MULTISPECIES: MCE family protein [Rhodococcus]MCZ4618693.1 MCE family protein [Rhodococcus qingshengii]MEA1798473.1 MCE family protein [Rhodococcus qingshengii]ORI28802.1 mammalian cell entry protein [Rhodococcus erythropolis]